MRWGLKGTNERYRCRCLFYDTDGQAENSSELLVSVQAAVTRGSLTCCGFFFFFLLFKVRHYEISCHWHWVVFRSSVCIEIFNWNMTACVYMYTYIHTHSHIHIGVCMCTSTLQSLWILKKNFQYLLHERIPWIL